MKRCSLLALVFFLAPLLLSGCGGGSSGSSAADGPAGVAVDPYISGAKFQEVLTDGTPGQFSTLSDAQGRFRFAEPLSDGSYIEMVAPGLHNGLPYEGDLKSCIELIDGELVVSPFTTVLANLIKSGLGVDEAKDVLLEMLQLAGHSIHAEDLVTDPMSGVDDGGALNVLQGAMAINGWLQIMSDLGENGFNIVHSDSYLSHLQNRQSLLIDMSAAMDNYLGEENMDALRGTLQAELPDGFPLDTGDMIRAAVTTCSYLTDQVAEDLRDGTLDRDMMTLMDDGSFEEALLRHYAARNMSNAEFSQMYNALCEQNPSLPAISSDAGFSMEDIHAEMSNGQMMGSWNQDGSWGMGSFGQMMP